MRGLPDVQWLRPCLPAVQGYGLDPLVGEPRSHMPLGQNQTIKQKQYLTNFRKTLKMVHAQSLKKDRSGACGPQWPAAMNCAHCLPLLPPKGPFHSPAQEHLCSFCQQGPQDWSVCPAGLVGVPCPWWVGMGTMTATPLQPCDWNAGGGPL